MCFDRGNLSTKCNFKLLFLSVVQNYINLIIRGPVLRSLFVATCSFGIIANFFVCRISQSSSRYVLYI